MEVEKSEGYDITCPELYMMNTAAENSSTGVLRAIFKHALAGPGSAVFSVF